MFGRTDAYSDKPKAPKMRLEHGIIKLSTSAQSSGNVLTFTATANIKVGYIASGNNIPNQGGIVGYNLLGPSVTNVTATTVTLTGTLANTVPANAIVTFAKPIVFRTGKAEANTYNANTVLITTTRKANANVVAKGSAHIGWNHYQVGTGGRAGRVQIETLVALSNAKATQANSGGPYFPGV